MKYQNTYFILFTFLNYELTFININIFYGLSSGLGCFLGTGARFMLLVTFFVLFRVIMRERESFYYYTFIIILAMRFC